MSLLGASSPASGRKDAEGGAAELDDDLADLLGQAFAASEVEGGRWPSASSGYRP